MPTSSEMKHGTGAMVRFVALALCMFAAIASRGAMAQSSSTAPTTINISDTPKMTAARRLGVNLGTQTYYDSGQLMRNIVFRNPGFEGEQWQSILHCQYVTATSCTDDALYAGWPANFLQGATVEFIMGNATGTFATVTSSTAANSSAGLGTIVQLSGLTVAPSVGDYLVVRFENPGNAQAGWWWNLSSGSSLSTEFQDLSPNTPGKQALRVTVPSGQYGTISSYMDDFIPGRSFLQLNGYYTLSFRAKSTGGSNSVNVSLARPSATYFNQNVALTSSWQDYSYTFQANDNGANGALALNFYLLGASMLLDDVSLYEVPSADNPTNYRNEVVTALKSLKPGTLRYMDSGQNWGSSLDNMLAPEFARERPGYSNYQTESDQIPMGLHDFLTLCQAIGAEPWYTLQTGMSLQEVSNLMDYLGGSTSTTYGAKRVALGQTAPWTTVFPTIHLEFGNEVWNTANPGASMTDPVSYAERAGTIFKTAKASASYSANSFDFIVDGFESVPAWNQTVLANSSNYDTIDVATYMFSNLNDTSSIENIYGPMFAEPESLTSISSGLTNQQAVVAAAATHPAHLAIYETQLATGSGTASQAAVNSTVPSVGAGIAQADNMLLAMRDLGVNEQNMFALTGYQFSFFTPAGVSGATTSPIYGSVVDMGGQSNLQRPTFLAEQLANSGILPTLLSTSQTGANPTWNQTLSTNDNVALAGAHYLQSFAFTDGNALNVIVLNLSRTTALPINFAGLNAPSGAATISTLTAPAITATNEASQNVAITSTTQDIQTGSTLTVPAYSMTVISVAAPIIPIAIQSISVTCANVALSANTSTTCTDNVVGQGKYNSGVSWTVDNGTISSAGVYTAPGILPASGQANITATSLQDSTKSATFPISLAVDKVTGVTASCAAYTIGWTTTTSCSAAVAGTGSYSNAYTWSVSAGSVSSNGTVTAPTSGETMTVTATSTQDSTQSKSITLSLTPVMVITDPIVVAGSSSIKIGWTVNILSRNGVNYSVAGSSNGAATPYNSTYTESPSFTLTGLAPGTSYQLLLTSYDSTQHAYKTVTVTTAKTTSSAITRVSVSCAAATLVQGSTTTCSAGVSGSGSYSTAYSWSISSGSITSAGAVTAPSTGTSVTVTATSTQDPTKSGSATIALTAPVATITKVGVSCGAASIVQGGSTSCTAVVTGNGSYSSGTKWSVSAGSITTGGAVTAPSTGTSITVTATSTEDPTKSGNATIALTAQAPTITKVAVSCGSASIVQSGTTSCTAAVAGTGSFSTGTTWSISAGDITSGGGVTAPSTGTSVTVTATSTEDSTKSGSATIALTAPTPTITGVSVTCGAASVVLGGTTSCSAAVTGTGTFSRGTTWSINGGSITSGGAVTAPSTGTSISVTATSTQDPTKSGTFTINLVAGMAITDPTSSSTSTTITVGWNVNVLARNGVNYVIAATSNGGGTPYDPTFTTTPSYTLTGLKPGTTYSLLLTSYNATGHAYKTISVTTPGSKPESITNVAVTCNASEVEVLTSTSCSASVSGTGSFSNHYTWSISAGSITSSGAVTAPSTGSTIKVTATSTEDPTKAGNYDIALLPAPSMVISDPVASVTATTLTVGWKVNVLSRNGVNYSISGTSNGSGTPYDPTFTTTPSYTLTGLKPSTTYTVLLTSYNESGHAYKTVTVTTSAQ